MQTSVSTSPDGNVFTFERFENCRHQDGREHSYEIEEILEFSEESAGRTSVRLTRTRRSTGAKTLEAWAEPFQERRRVRRYLRSNRMRCESSLKEEGGRT
jgi:hypothetical protein